LLLVCLVFLKIFFSIVHYNIFFLTWFIAKFIAIAFIVIIILELLFLNVLYVFIFRIYLFNEFTKELFFVDLFHFFHESCVFYSFINKLFRNDLVILSFAIFQLWISNIFNYFLNYLLFIIHVCGQHLLDALFLFFLLYFFHYLMFSYHMRLSVGKILEDAIFIITIMLHLYNFLVDFRYLNLFVAQENLHILQHSILLKGLFLLPIFFFFLSHVLFKLLYS